MIKEDIERITFDLKDDLIFNLRELLAIKSKKASKEGPYPYGKNCALALSKALEIGKKYGFNGHNIDNHMSYVSIGDIKSKGYVCAMGHLDVVDEMEGWDYPPFAGEIHNNKIFARGALDNKGPIMAAFYGLLVLKKIGINFNREFRIIFGSDEESGMADLKYYLSKEDPPLMGFTPDNKFPAIYGERARAKIEISGDYDNLENFINSKIFLGDPVKNLGIEIKDDDFGKMILRGKKIFRKDNKYGLSFSLSSPKVDIDHILDKIRLNANKLTVKLIEYHKEMLVDKNSDLVNILNDAYNDIRDENIKPTTTSGMTYAHYCPNIIPFGPSFPGQNGIAHLPNEWMDLKDLMELVKIYAYAFYKLNEYYKNKEEIL
ncbi:MAG: Sapep family Mn(2+)-dependent dipeptidase [Anaerococcus sp.]|nr:Sapep family Mn(2+)-dependent dipeptidase [Anaerococcus sp.]